MLDFEAMRSVWSSASVISCIHPNNSLIRGRDEVLASWREIFHATTQIHFQLRDVHAFVTNDTAWVVLTETIEARHGEAMVRASTQATNVFVREEGEWKLVH